MTSDLPELLLPLPLTEQELRQHLRERSLLFRRAAGESRFGELLSWESLRRLLETGELGADRFILTVSNTTLPEALYLTGGKVDAARLNGWFDKGVSLRTKRIECMSPPLEAVCADLGRRLGEDIGAVAVATTGGGGALQLHFDAPDVLALQIEGAKRWRIYDRPAEHPVQGMRAPEPPPDELIFDETLHPGDMLLIPRGYWHHCDNQTPGVSLHLSIVITPPTGWHAMRRLMPDLLSHDAFRVPLTRFGDPAARAAHEATLKQALVEMIGSMSMLDLASQALDRAASNARSSVARDAASD